MEAVDNTSRAGMVSSDNSLASEAGREILAAGGNAVDAAVATALALCVVKPMSNGIGGYGGCMVVYFADERRVTAIDYNCRAPLAATPDMYRLEEGWESCGIGQFPPVKGNANFVGPLAASVPGTVAGLAMAEQKYGRLGWARVLEPAMRLARDGFVVYEGLSLSLAGLCKENDEESVAAVFPDGRTPEDGERWVQPDLARLLQRLAYDPDVFYRGEVARQIAGRIQAMGGLITEEDMAAYQPVEREPLELEYKGTTVYACGGVCGGPTTLESLAVLQKLHPEPYRVNYSGYWGDLADTFTLTWRDRFQFIGDVAGIEESIRHLISDQHVSELAGVIARREVSPEVVEIEEPTCTVSLATCDSDHNMVALTQTHGGGWGSRVGIPGLGIVLGHGMSRFDPRPDHVNAPGPGKSPLHNMSPLIMTAGDKPFAAFGLPGGRTIPNVVAQLAVDLVDFRMTPAQAISHPRIHAEAGPIQVAVDVTDEARMAITSRGHAVREIKSVGGKVSALIIRGGEIVGASQAGPDAALPA